MPEDFQQFDEPPNLVDTGNSSAIEAKDKSEQLELSCGGDHFIGKVIENKYEVSSLLGEGGIGTVYKAKHLHLNKNVAIKFLAPALIKDQRALERFQKEAEISCTLTHPNIVTVREFGISDANPYLIMDYIEGTSLKAALSSQKEVDEKTIIKRMIPVLEALEHAHNRGIIHRDIKPANIILENRKDSPVTRILDFGIAKMLESDSATDKGITRTGEIFGTPTYMSPEQCNSKAVNATTDIYSVGCVLYELTSGSPPFGGSTALETIMKHLNDPVPPIVSNEYSKAFKEIIYKCLEKDPKHRYQSATLLKQDLQSLLQGDKIKIKRHRSLARYILPGVALSVFATIAVLVGMTIFLLINPNATSTKQWQQYEQQAKAAFKRGDQQNLIALLKKAIDNANKENAPVEARLFLLRQLSGAYLDNGMNDAFKKARREYIALADKEGMIRNSEDALIDVADIEYKSGDLDQATKDLSRLTVSLAKTRGESFPGLIRVYELFGRVNFAQGEYKEAVDNFQKAVDHSNEVLANSYMGSLGIAHYHLALIDEKNDDLNSAYKHIRLAKNFEESILNSSQNTSMVDREFLAMPVNEALEKIKAAVESKE